MFRKDAVAALPFVSATSSQEGRAQAVLLSPEEFNRVANGPEGPFVVFEPMHWRRLAWRQARAKAGFAYERAPPMRPTGQAIGKSHR